MASTEPTQPQVQPEPAVTPQGGNRFSRMVRDPAWQFLGAVIAIALFVGGYYLQRPVKQLDVTLLARASVFDVRPEVANEIQVEYQGRPIQDLVFADFRIVNSGNQPITEDDYSEPVTITFNRSYEIVEAQITKSEPDNIGLGFELQEGYLAAAEPVLLNAGDSVEIRFILLSEESEPSFAFDVAGRIVGVKEVRVRTPEQLENERSARTVLMAAMATAVFMLFALLVAIWANRKSKQAAALLLKQLQEQAKDMAETEFLFKHLQEQYNKQSEANRIRMEAVRNHPNDSTTDQT